LHSCFAEWCNGSTADSGSVCHGSNPCSAAIFHWENAVSAAVDTIPAQNSAEATYSDAKLAVEKLTRDLAPGRQAAALTSQPAADGLAGLEVWQGFCQSAGRRLSLPGVAVQFTEAVGRLNGDSPAEGIGRFRESVVTLKRISIEEAIKQFIASRKAKTLAADGRRPQSSPKHWRFVLPRSRQFGTRIPMIREKPIQFQFNERKAVQAAARLITHSGGEINYMALIKLLYLIDRESLLRFGRPVTGDSVVAMKQGPVLSAIFDRVSQKKQQLPECAWHNFIPRPAPYVYTVRFGGVPDTSALSEAEVALIDEIYARHRNLSGDELVELTHKLPEWSDPGKSSKPIPFEAILRAENKGEDEIRAIQREASADGFLDRMLAPV
jgi:uncharacterized phage-associated protein